MTDAEHSQSIALLREIEQALLANKRQDATALIVNVLQLLTGDRMPLFRDIRSPRYCGYCGAQLTGNRLKKFCDDKCRVYAFRKQKSAA